VELDSNAPLGFEKRTPMRSRGDTTKGERLKDPEGNGVEMWREEM